jgi:hypothetical protein
VNDHSKYIQKKLIISGCLSSSCQVRGGVCGTIMNPLNAPTELNTLPAFCALEIVHAWGYKGISLWELPEDEIF